MQLNPLTLDQKSLFDQYNLQSTQSLSSYAFANHFIWRDCFDYYYTIHRTKERSNADNFNAFMCIYAKQGDDYFMPILPIPCRIECPCYIKTVCSAYQFMLISNKNREIARIENVPEAYLSTFIDKGFHYIQKEADYTYLSQDISALKGNRYKQQRNAYNTFLRNYETIQYGPYHPTDQDACIELYDRWRKTRVRKYDDTIYQAMLDDSRSAHRIGITNAEALGLSGRTVKVKEKVCAYTFGYELNSESFCILFEISDLHIKGVSQFIFREFCRELSSSYKWINTMGDSGLENLKRVKRAYHPKQIIPSFNIYEDSTHIP